MVPTTQSADLRAYYFEHTKNDQLDSKLLARLPLLHPEGLREQTGDGPADPLRRVVKVRSTMVKRRTAVFSASTPSWNCSARPCTTRSGSHYGKAALAVLARYADPNALIRFGRPPDPVSDPVLPRRVARAPRHPAVGCCPQSLELWVAPTRIDFAELAADIAVEAEQAQVITEQIEDLDERFANLYAEADPTESSPRRPASARGVHSMEHRSGCRPGNGRGTAVAVATARGLPAVSLMRWICCRG